MPSPLTISVILLVSGIVIGVLGSLLGFSLDKENKKPHLAPLRYLGAAFLIGIAINALIWAYCYFQVAIKMGLVL